MCSGCGERKTKQELIRIVRGAEGEIALDYKGKASGRGAYICKEPDCLKKARKARRLERALKCKIPDEIYAALERELLTDEQ